MYESFVATLVTGIMWVWVKKSTLDDEIKKYPLWFLGITLALFSVASMIELFSLL